MLFVLEFVIVIVPCSCTDSLFLMNDLPKYYLVVCVNIRFDFVNCLRVIIFGLIVDTLAETVQKQYALETDCSLVRSTFSSMILKFY